MARRSSKLDVKLLDGIRRELKRLLAIDLESLPWLEKSRLRGVIEDAGEGIVAADWHRLMGRALTAAELKAAQRAAERLELAGELVRISVTPAGRKVTHLQLVGADATEGSAR